MIDPNRPPLYRHVGTFATRDASDDVAAAFKAFRTRTVAAPNGYVLQRESTAYELDERDRVLVMRVVADNGPVPARFEVCDV